MSGRVSDKKYYQYTATDEYSRFRYPSAFDEISAYDSALFPEDMLKFFKFKFECVRTDNSPEPTNSFTSHKRTQSLFEKSLAERGIRHKLIRPYTPGHNGKVERSHRKDNEYFYAIHKFYSLNDLSVQPAKHNRKYNNFPMRPLKRKSPREALKDDLC